MAYKRCQEVETRPQFLNLLVFNLYFFLELFTVGIFLTHAQLNVGVTFAKNSHQKSFILSACVDIKNILNSHHFAKNWEDAFQAMDFFFPVITELDMHLMVLNP